MSSTPVPATRDIDELLAFVDASEKGHALEAAAASQAVVQLDAASALSGSLLHDVHGPATRANWTDKLRMLQLKSLQCIRASLSIDGAFSAHARLDEVVFPRLLVFLHSLERWSTVQFAEAIAITPSDLRAYALDTAVELLLRLGEDLPNRNAKPERGWELLSETISRLLQIIQELRTLSSHSLPAVINTTKAPFVQDASVVEDPFKSAPTQEIPTNPTITIGNRAQLFNFATTALVILSRALQPTFVAECFLQAPLRSLQEEIASYASVMVGVQLNQRTVHLFARIVECMQHYCVSERPAGHFERHVTRILIRRVKEGPSTSLQPLDRAIADMFEVSDHAANATAGLVAIEALRQGPWHGEQSLETESLLNALYTCLWRSCALLDQKQMEEIAQILAHLPPSPQRRRLGERMESLSMPPVAGPTTVDAAEDRVSLSTIIASLGLDVPMDIDLTVGRCLELIKRASEDLSTDQCALIRGLHQLASSTYPNAERCPLTPTFVAIIQAIHPIETPETQRLAFEALYKAVCSDAEGWDADMAEDLATLARRGLHAPSRCVRLSAGELVVAVVQQCQVAGVPADVLIWCDLLTEPFDNAQQCVRETAIVSMGALGKVGDDIPLLTSIRCLIAQLSEKNVLLRGLAHLQLRNLATHRKKSFYNVVSSFLPELSCLVVSKLKAAPLMLIEFCQLLGLKPVDFLTQTLQYTLPGLVHDLDASTLEKLSADLVRSLPTLILGNAHTILTRVFLSNNTDVIFEFMLNLLHQDGNPKAQVKGDTFVRSCVLALVCELVCCLGDTDQMEGRDAISALEKVQRKISSTASRRSTATVSTFLQPYLLGIMTHFNDLLHDLRGRKTIQDKNMLLRSLGSFFVIIGPPVYQVAHQSMALLQSTIKIHALGEASIGAWYKFIRALLPTDIGPYVGPLSAAIVTAWPDLSPSAQQLARQTLEHCIVANSMHVESHVDKIVDLSGIPLLARCAKQVAQLRAQWSTRDTLEHLLQRCAGENLAVTTQSLLELQKYIKTQGQQFLNAFAAGDVFDPLISRIVDVLLAAAALDGEDVEPVHLIAFEILGMLGALDPDRFESQTREHTYTLLQNFDDLTEAGEFAVHLLEELLVPAFRSTSDPRFQTTTGFAIQELSKFCSFTVDLDRADGKAVKQSIRKLWNALTQTARDTIAPFRGAKFVVQEKERAVVESFPIYPSQASYRDWLQTWAAHLLSRVSSPAAKSVFSSCRGALRGNDARVALFLIPHLVLHILISGTDQDRDSIRQEIVVILEDLVTPTSGATVDRRTLSAQMIFTLLDHLNRWVRYARQYAARANDARRRKPGSAGTHLATALEERVFTVHSVLSSIDRALMARAAFQCKAYARALMNLEQQVLERRQLDIDNGALKDHYERLHEIYCLVDEPDGMEGISALILSPSMEAQIRQHESTGRWTAAQSCWEVQLQQSPNELSLHAGLLRCLRNLGHYDTLRTHIQGVLTRNPEWKDDLAGFELESAWIVRDWDRVKAVTQDTVAQTAESTMARLLLALRTEDDDSKRAAYASARLHLGSPVTSGGRGSYRRSYDAIMNLHVVHELELTQHEFGRGRPYEPSSAVIPELSRRFDAVLPTFRTHESLLNMRRTAFGLSMENTATRREAESFSRAIGKSWLLSAKIARKAGHYQTAYSALLQASQNGATFAFIQNCKLTRENGDAIKALNELTAELAKYKGATGEEKLDVAAHRLSADDKEQLAKAMVLRARWMQDTTRFIYNDIVRQFSVALEVCKGWESAYFHLGHYQDEWQRHLSEADKLSKSPTLHMNIVQNYALSLEYGSKNIYQTMPRMLTLWLDLGEERAILLAEKEGKTDVPNSKYKEALRAYKSMNNFINRAMNRLAVYKWFTAFPQIVSRVDHQNKTVGAVLAGLISKVIVAYPQQGLWFFMAVKNSKNPNREQRGQDILQQLQNRKDRDLNQLINLADQMTTKLIDLCDFAVAHDPPTMGGNFPELIEYAHSPAKFILPLQESLTATLPPRGAVEAEHQPFPLDLPLICGFDDDIEIMRSMQKPRRITIISQNGQRHMMMAKPKDDLRKDARLMDFNTIINKLLKTKSESRRRQLHIRTYSVVTLNEECGLLQWVPNTTPIRNVLCKLYEPRGINCLASREIGVLQVKLKEITKEILKDVEDKKPKDPIKEAEIAKIFTSQLLPLVPPVMHEWFLDSFPDPSAWLASRMAYSRTTAVISMVGYVLGLGDRHSENILIDQASGDIVHVDFNMLFEKGKTLDMPERVPFRLTQNVVDGMGITGTEGVYRIACELVMKLLRDYKDCLMNVLEAFIHDPLVEWGEEKRRRERLLTRGKGITTLPKADRVDVKALAKTALHLIHRKLSGMQAPNDPSNERIISTSDQVAALISEAIDPRNLGKMYQGWAPHL